MLVFKNKSDHLLSVIPLQNDVYDAVCLIYHNSN